MKKDNPFKDILKDDSLNPFKGIIQEAEQIVNPFKDIVSQENPFTDIVKSSTLEHPTTLATEFFKGIAAGTEIAAGQSIGSPLIAAGEHMQLTAKKDVVVRNPWTGKIENLGPPKKSEFLTKTGRQIESIGTKIRDFFINNAQKGIEAPSDKIMRATFGKTGYGRRLAYSLGSSVTMMAAAIGISAATKNPLAGASIFGPQAFGQFYDNAREADVPIGTAIKLALVNAAGQVGLETVPMTGWLKKGGGVVKRMIRGAVQEGLIEEGSQQILTNALEGIGWKGKDVNLLDGVVESVIVGTIMGTGMGMIPSSATVEDIKVRAKKKIAKDILAGSEGIDVKDVKSVIDLAHEQIDNLSADKIAKTSEKVQETIIEDSVKKIENVVGKSKGQVKPKTLFGWTIKSGKIKTSLLQDYLGKEWKQNISLGIAKNEGRDPVELYEEAVQDGVITPMPKDYIGGEGQYFIDQVKGAKKEYLEDTNDFWKKIEKEHKEKIIEEKKFNDAITTKEIEESKKIAESEVASQSSEEIIDAHNWRLNFFNEFESRITNSKDITELQDVADELAIELDDVNQDDINVLMDRVDAKQAELIQPTSQQKSSLASKSTIGAIGEAERIMSDTQKAEEFKIYEKVDSIIHKYAARFGERYTPKGTVGALYPDTGNIFLRGANALFTAIHEVTHYIDTKEGISNAALRLKGISKNGQPIYDPSTKVLRKEMTDFYTHNYPGGRKTHKLSRRMAEGLARFVEMYVYKPTYIKNNYPYLYNHVLKQGGEFFNTTTLDLVRDSRNVVEEYQALSPTQKILARQLSKERKIANSYLSTPEKIYTEVVDALFPMEKLTMRNKAGMTVRDPSVWTRFANNGLSTITANNIFGKKGFWAMNLEGDFVQKHSFNWKTIVDSIAGDTDIFGAWLNARDTKFNYDRLNELIKQIEQVQATADLKDKLVVEKLKDFVRKADALKKQLRINGITKEEADAAYSENKDRFAKQEQMYDALTQEDLELLHHPMIQSLNDSLYDEFSTRKGYSPQKRDFFFNEILGEQAEYTGNVKIGKTKVSSMLSRKGSELPVLNPLYSSLLNHVEVMRKSIRQLIYNKIYDLAPSWPQVLQPVPLKTAITSKGEIFFPQEKDANILMARKNYKRAPLIVAQELKQVIDETVTHQNVHIIEKWMKQFSRIFVKGTTAMFPPFVLTNFSQDTISAAAQTQTKLIPIISPLKELMLTLDNHSDVSVYFKEYLILGGERQTLMKYLDGNPNEVLNAIQKEKSGIEKVTDLISQGMDIFTIPTQYSEILNRATEFIRARREGDNQVVALEKAGQITGPFHHRGRWGGSIGRSWISSIPFFNPSIQIIAKYFATLNNPQTRRKAVFVTALLIGGMVSSFEYLRYKSTEEQKNLYKSLQPDELGRYLFLPHPDGRRLLRLRLPENMAEIGTLINMTLANLQMDTKYKPKEFVEGTLSWLPEQFNPLNPSRMLFSWIPHILLTPIGLATGKKFYPQVKDIEGPSVKYLPQGERAYPYTSKVAKFLGANLGLSPIKIDYLVEGFFGRATRLATGKKLSNPLIRKMYFYSSRQLQEYYDIKEKNTIEFKNIDSVQDLKQRRRIRRTRDKIQEIDRLIKKFRKVELQPDQKDDSYIASLRARILDDVDTLWEVER